MEQRSSGGTPAGYPMKKGEQTNPSKLDLQQRKRAPNVLGVFLADFDLDKGNTLRHKICSSFTLSCSEE